MGDPPALVRLKRDIPYNPHNTAHQELVRYITEYSTSEDATIGTNENPVYGMLKQAGLALPSYNAFFFTTQRDLEYYSDQDFKKLNALLESDTFLPAVRSLKFSFERDEFHHGYIISNGEALMKMIRNYHPEARLLFKDVGIIVGRRGRI